jgi:hypothetical protein
MLVKILPFNITNDSVTETVNYIFGKTRQIRHLPNAICQKGIKFCKQKVVSVNVVTI